MPRQRSAQKECETRVRALDGVTSVEIEMTAQVRGGHTHGHAQAGGAKRLSIPSVKNVIAVASGKGGVGKSTVTINLAMALAQTGARVGLLDADIYGPSIPLMMGTKERPFSNGDQRITPVEKGGVKLMSMGFLIPEDQAVVWRGPMVHGALTQFLTQVDWGELDYLLIDMPPGTGDAQLTISQTAPLSGALIVTTPQEVSLLDARRGALMFNSVNVPILGIIENMAGFVAPIAKRLPPFFAAAAEKKSPANSTFLCLAPFLAISRVARRGRHRAPIVVGHPETPVARQFTRIAGEVAAKLSVLQARGQGTFEPMTLQWQ